MALLYSDEGYDPYPCKDSNDTDCFKVAVNDAAYSLTDEFVGKPAWTLKMLLPAGAKDFFAVEPGDIMKFTSDTLSEAFNSDDTMQIRTVVRGLIKKMPGF